MVKINNYKTRKSQMNQVFVYAFSIIIVLFVGFLATKFISTFTQDVEKRDESLFYNDFENDFHTVFTNYGAEKIFNYRVSREVSLVCFIKDINCIDSMSDIDNEIKSDMKVIRENDENIMILDKDGIVNSHKSEKGFEIEGVNNCLCIKPNSGRFSMIITNTKNTVYISNNDD